MSLDFAARVPALTQPKIYETFHASEIFVLLDAFHHSDFALQKLNGECASGFAFPPC
jgi:hypothetical protein